MPLLGLITVIRIFLAFVIQSTANGDSQIEQQKKLEDQTIGALVRPVHWINIFFTIPTRGGSRNITADAVILEITWVQSVKLSQRRKHTIIQNNAVDTVVEVTMNRGPGSQNKLGKTLSDRNSTSNEFNSGHNAI
ncbi:hypothetical protein TNCV_2844241 [Trichonephila clavipes]|nr:hypothetical protein TNCV_2844241 [Trichonephila clavipes]